MARALSSSLLPRLLIVLLLGNAGCSDDSTSPDSIGPCTGNVVVSVSSGTTPTFTWTPACRVIGLLVEEEAGDVWFIEATGEGIAPGLQYGTVPPGASADEPATPLVPGTAYEVILFRGTAQNATIAAIKQFTP